METAFAMWSLMKFTHWPLEFCCWRQGKMQAVNFTELNNATQENLHIFFGRVVPYLVQGLLFGGISPYLLQVTDEGSYECPQGRIAHHLLVKVFITLHNTRMTLLHKINEDCNFKIHIYCKWRWKLQVFGSTKLALIPLLPTLCILWKPRLPSRRFT